MSRRNIRRIPEMRAAVALAALAACRGIDVDDAEVKVEHIAEQTMKVEVTRVHCPEAKRAAGVVVACEVTFAEGGSHRMELWQLDRHGNFVPRWETPIISTTLLGESLAETTRLETGRAVAADCGRGVREITEAGFACTVDGRAVTVQVDARDASWRIMDAAGRARP